MHNKRLQLHVECVATTEQTEYKHYDNSATGYLKELTLNFRVFIASKLDSSRLIKPVDNEGGK